MNQVGLAQENGRYFFSVLHGLGVNTGSFDFSIFPHYSTAEPQRLARSSYLRVLFNVVGQVPLLISFNTQTIHLKTYQNI
jgi:hypothetical protein